MSIPNKPTLIAAVLYGISTQAKTETRKGVVPTAWSDLTADQRKPFFAAAEYLAGQTFGVGMQSVDRAKLAASFEAQKIEEVDADANVVVSVFVNVASVLP